jgi:hypothetical protein
MPRRKIGILLRLARDQLLALRRPLLLERCRSGGWRRIAASPLGLPLCCRQRF